MIRKPTISDESVEKATGKKWDEWFAMIDQEGGKKMSHAEIARMLFDKKYIESGWWCQGVTVQYEYARGKRIIGQTADVGFEIGVQKLIPISQKVAWELITSQKGLSVWLGKVKNLDIKAGTTYKTEDGTTGEIRTVKPGERIRLTWKSKASKSPSTLQVTLMCPRNTKDKTNINFHQEKLTSKTERERMRKHWQKVLEDLQKLS